MMKFKKYILFQYDDYYPAGGLDDIKGSFDTIEEAQTAAKSPRESCEEYDCGAPTGKRIEWKYDTSVVIDRDSWECVWKHELDN